MNLCVGIEASLVRVVTDDIKVLLAIHTTSEKCSVALLRNGHKLGFACSTDKNQHSRDLFNLLDEIFEESKMNYCDISHLAVSVGPGSFTGIRIGMSVASGIACASEIKILPVTEMQIAGYKDQLRCTQEVRINICRFEYKQIINENLHSISKITYSKSSARDACSNNALDLGMCAIYIANLSLDFSAFEPLYILDSYI